MWAAAIFSWNVLASTPVTTRAPGPTMVRTRLPAMAHTGYIFTVYALDVPTLELDGDTSIAAVAFHALSHTLARAELTVTYEIKA